jgi:hypothetical protein
MFMKTCPLALAFSLAIFLGGCAPPHLNLNAPVHSRPPNQYELFFTAVAADFGDSRICEKISKRALEEEIRVNTGWTVTLQRSVCNFHAAVKTEDTRLCDSVKRVITIPHNEADISPSACRKLLRRTPPNDNFKPWVDIHFLGGFMEEMGYREDTAKILLINSERFDWGDFYVYLMLWAPLEQKQEFLQRVKALPSFTD